LWFGTDPNWAGHPAEKVLSHVAATTTGYEPGTMGYSTSYYWRVDAYEPNSIGEKKTNGGTWSFTTRNRQASCDPVSPAKSGVDAGTNAVLTVTAYNADTYRWYKVGSPDVELANGADYSGVNTNTLTIYDVQLADEGSYYCQVDNNLSGTDPVNSVSGLVMTKRLIVYYPLDTTTVVDGNSVTPDTVGGYDMTLVSDGNGSDYPTLVTAPDPNVKIGIGAIRFNNKNSADPNNFWGQYATAGDVDIEAMGNGFTIELWMNNAGDNGATGGVVVRRNSWAAGQMMWDVEIRPTGNIYFATSGLSTSEVPTVKNTWTHVAITHDGVSTARVYINGEFEAQATNVPYWGGVNSPLMLAAANYDSVTGLAANFFNGVLDDVKIYNYVRNTAQIAQDYLAVNGGWVCDNEGPVEMTYDFDKNCQVDLADFAMLAADWLNSNRIYPQ
jgi:hypothetical protein